MSALTAARPGPQEGAGSQAGRWGLEPVLGLGLPAAEPALRPRVLQLQLPLLGLQREKASQPGLSDLSLAPKLRNSKSFSHLNRYGQIANPFSLPEA